MARELPTYEKILSNSTDAIRLKFYFMCHCCRVLCRIQRGDKEMTRGHAQLQVDGNSADQVCSSAVHSAIVSSDLHLLGPIKNAQICPLDQLPSDLPVTDDSHRGTILVADDDPICVELISTVLKNAGWNVKTAKDGRCALETIHSTDIDALILDMRMPEYDGFEVCLNLMRQGKNIPTLVITGCIGDSEPLGYVNVEKTLCKPVSRKHLLDFAEKACAPTGSSNH